MLQLTALDVVVSLLDILFLVLLLLIINFYTKASQLSNSFTWVSTILNEKPLWSFAIFSFFFALKNWVAYIVTKQQFHFVYKVASRLSENKLSNYLDGSYTSYVNIDSSVHMRAIFNNAIEFAHYILRGVQQIIGQVVLILFALVPIIIFKPVLFSLLVLVLFPPVLFLSFSMKKRLRLIRDSAKTTNAHLIQHLKEAIAGFVESNIYKTKNFFLNRFVKYQRQQSQSLSEQQIIQSIPSRLIEVFVVFGLFFLVIINFITKGKSIDIITIGAFMAAAYKIIPGIVKIWNNATQIRTYEFTVNELLKSYPVVKGRAIAEQRSINSVKFSNIGVTFKDKPVLKDFSFEVRRGEFIGLSGMSGKGKTTAVNLLLGFLEPLNESIFINNSLKDSTERQYYWQNISYVQQRTFLINDTILKNITLDEDRVDQKKLDNVISITGLRQVINRGTDGLDKKITEDGKNISGGQRQRIALARALYKDFDLLILDEPFSELDAESEVDILEKLKPLTKEGKMILLITHNRSSLHHCDKVVSLND